MRIFYFLSFLMFFISVSASEPGKSVGKDIPPTTSLVYPGTNGRLIYVADSLGNMIPDFSYAGYMGGGVAIPYVTTKEIIWPVKGDNSPNIQAAIDRVSALTPDASGFRGAVLLRMGTYELFSPIYIKASGVVLRGEGMSDVGTILIGKVPENKGTNIARQPLVSISGSTGATINEGSKQIITDKYVPVGSRTINVVSAKAFKTGDKVIIRRIGNEAWIKEIGEDSESAGRFAWRPFNISYDRIVMEVKGNAITVDAPIFTAIDERWGGGDIYKYDDPGRIENSGVENLRGISEYDPEVRITAYGNIDRGSWDDPRPHYDGEEYYSDEKHYYNFISISNAKNAWVRNITALHFASSLVSVAASSKWITVEDCESREPVSIRAGARRFTYQLSGQLSLVQRCTSQKGRHSFVMGSPSSTGNVFLDCSATMPYSTSEPHSNWVNGALYDNIQAPLSARYWKDINIGWAGANIVFWNCEGDYMIQSPPTAKNYSFGHIGLNAVVFNAIYQDYSKKRGHIEYQDVHVAPRSLYLTQLKDRLGMEAVLNVVTEEQAKK
ncbi:MAG TPA: hypothetical protein VHO50_03045 [Bacteroidales bacterium]|nr:hypothetical protein [Bacteroidales bacterium]